ncbi:MAG: hypothetical protein HKL90_07165 [Elusimicrobia bacterium]|nr:hypothetical protein [Elusimicrobiota bacterium]
MAIERMTRAQATAPTMIVIFGAALLAGLIATAPSQAAPARPAMSQKVHDDLYAIYNSSAAASVIRLHAWRLLSRIESSLPRPDFGVTQPSAAAVSAVITTAQGGRLARADGAAVDIPAGSLTSDTLVSISTSPAMNSPDENARTVAAAAAGLVAASPEVDFGPAGLRLRRTIEVAIGFAAQGQSAFGLRLYCWSQALNQWQRLPARIDVSHQVVSTRVLSLEPCRIFTAPSAPR